MHYTAGIDQYRSSARRKYLRTHRFDVTMSPMPKAQGPVQSLGPIGERVAENVQRLRGSMTYRELSERLEAIGRPIPVLGLSRIESKARRVDADDLVALAKALGVSPPTLLMPHQDPGVDFLLTPNGSTSWQAAWRWATGEQSLTDDELHLTDDRVRGYVRENRPYEQTPFVKEAARFLLAREPSAVPWTAKIGWDGQRISTYFAYEDQTRKGSGDGER